MFWGRDGQPVGARIGRHALGHCPRRQDAITLQPEIEVVTARVVLLDDEPPARRTHGRLLRVAHASSMRHRARASAAAARDIASGDDAVPLRAVSRYGGDVQDE